MNMAVRRSAKRQLTQCTHIIPFGSARNAQAGKEVWVFAFYQARVSTVRH
jgi:hypothetical protein